MEPLHQTNWLSALGQLQIAVARFCLGAAALIGLVLVVAGPPS